MKELEKIITVCENYFGVKRKLFFGKTRIHEYVLIRQICHYLARRLTDISTTVIGAKMGGKDHATCLYSEKQIKDYLTYDKEIQRTIQILLSSLMIKKNEVFVFNGYTQTMHYCNKPLLVSYETN